MKLKFLLILLILVFSFGLVSAEAKVETGSLQASSTGEVYENIGFRPDYIEFITAQQIESTDFKDADPENRDCSHNVNGWSEGSAIFDDSGLDKQFSIGMFRNSDSTNGHITASSTNHVIRNVYTSQDGNECGRLEASVTGADSNGFYLDISQKYSYNEIIGYKAYQFPDNMNFDAGMTKITSEGSLNVNGLGFRPANLHFRAGQQISSSNSVNSYWRAPAGRSKGYTTLDQDGNVIDQQSIGTASSSDSTNAHRSIASDEYVINTVYVDQNGNLVNGGEPSRLEAKVTGANDDGFTLQVDNKWSASDEMILWRAWGFSWYNFDIGYSTIGDSSSESFNTGFEPDAIDIYAEQQINSINNEVLTPRNSGCSNAGGWSNGFYNGDTGEQWAISTGRTSDSQDSHRYGMSTSNSLLNLYNYDGNDCGDLEGEVTSVNSNGFEMSFNTDSNFDSNYGQEMLYYRALEFIQAPPQIKEISFVNRTDEHAFTLKALIREGSEDIQSCQVVAEDSSGASSSYNANIVQLNNTHSECTQLISYDDNSNWESRHNTGSELIDIETEVNIEDTAGQTDSSTAPNTFPNNEPLVALNGDSFTKVTGKHAFSIDSEITFNDNSEHEFKGSESTNDACSIRLEGLRSGNVYNSTTSPEFDANFTYLGGDDAKCSFKPVEPLTSNCADPNCGGAFDFNVLENINVTVEAYDHHGAVGASSFVQEIPNQRPNIEFASPRDGESVIEGEVNLETRVTESEGDSIDLEFSNADTGSTIETLLNEAEGRHQAAWNSLDGRGDYTWSLNVSDAYGSTIEDFNFKKIISRSYRINNRVQHEYSSLIVDKGGSKSLIFESSIGSGPREVKTYLGGEGIDAKFVDTGSSTKTYQVSEDNPVRNQIIVSGEEVGETKLEIVSEDQELNINTTETFPVYVRPSNDEGRGVPGLTGIYLLFILLAGSYLYFESL